MSYSKFVLRSTLSVLALLTANSTAAYALTPSQVTDMGLLQARSAWNVAPVKTQNNGYCAMVGKYDRGVTLAFARNRDGFGSLAINFTGKALQTGKTYDVMMQVDDMDARQYSVRAGNPNSLIVQIGQDEDFYNALGGNGTLHIDLETVRIDLALNDFSRSYVSLVSCADTLEDKNDGPKTAAVPVSPVEKTPLAGGNNNNAKVAAAIPAAPPSPATALTPAEAKVSAPVPLTAPVAAPAAAKAPAVAEGGLPTTVISSVTTSEIEQQKSRETLQQQADLVRKFADDSRLTQEENKELKVKLAKAQEEQAEAKNKLALLKLEKDELLSRVDMQERQSKVMEAALSAKERDLSAVRGLSIEDNRALVNVRKELDDMRKTQTALIQDLQNKLAEKTQQYVTLQNQYADLEKMYRSAMADTSRAQTELDLSRQGLSETQQRLSSNERQNKALFENMRDQLDKARSQMAMFESQISTVSMQKDDLSNRLDIQTRQNNDLRNSLEEKDRQISSLTARISHNSSVNNTYLPAMPEVSQPLPLPTPAPAVVPMPEKSTYSVPSLPPSLKDRLPPVGGEALYPPALQPIIERPGKSNISGSKTASLPAITPQVSTGRDISGTPVLKLKASATDLQTSPLPADESWDTIIVQ